MGSWLPKTILITCMILFIKVFDAMCFLYSPSVCYREWHVMQCFCCKMYHIFVFSSTVTF